MKTPKSAVFLVLITLSIWACRKDPAPAPPPPVPGVMSINLSLLQPAYPPVTAAELFELIISDSIGNKLLDTMVQYNERIISDITTSAKLVDVTVITKLNQTLFQLNSYKAVDPTAWQDLPGSDTSLSSTLPFKYTKGSTLYTNINVPAGSKYEILTQISAMQGAWNGGDILDTAKDYYAFGEYNFIIFPYAGLYNLHRISQRSDTVDLSQMDTAVGITFKKPAIYAAYFDSSPTLFGYADLNDPSKWVNLTYHLGGRPANADYYYPGRKGFKKYYFSTYANDPTLKEQAVLWMPFTDTIPAVLNLPEPTWYSVTASPSVTTFDFKSHRPTYYEVSGYYGSAPRIFVNLISTPDSTTLHPQAFLASLHPKLFQQQDISTLTLRTYNINTIDVLDYKTYWSGLAGPAIDSTILVSNQIMFTHLFY